MCIRADPGRRAFPTRATGFIGISNALAEWLASLGLSPIQLIIYLAVFFIALDCFLDRISVIMLTTSVVLPMVTQIGIDPIRFGIFTVAGGRDVEDYAAGGL